MCCRCTATLDWKCRILASSSAQMPRWSCSIVLCLPFDPLFFFTPCCDPYIIQSGTCIQPNARLSCRPIPSGTGRRGEERTHPQSQRTGDLFYTSGTKSRKAPFFKLNNIKSNLRIDSLVFRWTNRLKWRKFTGWRQKLPPSRWQQQQQRRPQLTITVLSRFSAAFREQLINQGPNWSHSLLG